MYGLLRLAQRRCEFSLRRSITIISNTKVGVVGLVVRARRGVGMGGCDEVGRGTGIICLPGPDGAVSGCTKSRVADPVCGGGRGEEI